MALDSGINATLQVDTSESTYPYVLGSGIDVANLSSGSNVFTLSSANTCTAALIDIDLDIWSICGGYAFGYGPTFYPASGSPSYNTPVQLGYGATATVMATFPAP